MTKKVVLTNGREWRSRTAAIEHFQKMLAKYHPGQRVSDPTDHDDLLSLLVRYDATLPSGMPTKIGVGISHFSKELNFGDGWTSPGFHLHRTDGTSDDFSYRHAISDPED